MLAGLARCGQCGGLINAAFRKPAQRRVRYYVCAWRRARGESVCPNSFGRPAEPIDIDLTNWIRENVLQERVVVGALEVIRQRLAERSRTSDTAALARSDDPSETMVAAITERERRLRAIWSQLEGIRRQSQIAAWPGPEKIRASG
jgi:hypothetical protein